MPFREVHGEDAGPEAIGILVPPGRRTLVVVRPRSLNVDLLLVRRGDEGEGLHGFHEAGRGEMAMLARNLGRAFGSASVEVIAAANGIGRWVRAEIGAFALIVCARVPGQPYRPLAFATEASARQAAAGLRDLLCPAPDVECQFYLNTEHFSR